MQLFHVLCSRLILLLIPLIARFTAFCAALDAEMREAKKLGVAEERKWQREKRSVRKKS